MKTYEIISKKQFSEKVNEYVVYAPDVAHRARAGQFIILRATEDGEIVPFTVCDYDREKGTITILVQTVGYSTMILEKLSVGDTICDFVGPLGKPTDLSGFDKILFVGGGIGSAVIYPQAKQLMLENKAADVIVGARNESLVIYENDFKKFSNEFFVMTDDGSAGEKGFVTYSSIPDSKPVSKSNSSARAESIIMGRSLFLRISRVTAQPSISGIIMSIIARSIPLSALKMSSASFPSAAQTVSYPEALRKSETSFTILSSSSAISIFFFSTFSSPPYFLCIKYIINIFRLY